MAQMTIAGHRPLQLPRRMSGRAPEARDYGLFLVVMPLLLGLFFAVVGIGPARLMDLGSGFAYAGSQFVAAWWGNALGCFVALRVLPRAWRPLAVVLVVGHLLACLPLYWFFREHALFFQNLIPQISAQASVVEWNGDYVLRLLRYSSLPFLMLWFVCVYGYRQWTGVEIFGEPASRRRTPVRPADESSRAEQADQPPVRVSRETRPGFLARSALPGDAEIMAIKAEEHYIKVWSTAGTDLVRYRFGDAVADADADSLPGDQVHRSWWVRWDAVTGVQRRGRALELSLGDDGPRVPVSRAHMALVRRQLGERETPRR
jgi:hypothetical protein